MIDSLNPSVTTLVLALAAKRYQTQIPRVRSLLDGLRTGQAGDVARTRRYHSSAGNSWKTLRVPAIHSFLSFSK